jgi:hypothetical protein
MALNNGTFYLIFSNINKLLDIIIIIYFINNLLNKRCFKTNL